MKDRCLNLEEIALAAEADAGDDLRRHLDRCGRCQALAASLDLFRRDGELPAGADPADLADADDRLADFLEREVAAPAAPAAPVKLDFQRTRRSRKSTGPLLWAAAAVLAFAVGIPVLIQQGPAPEEKIRLRADQGASRSTWEVFEPARLDDGTVRVGWAALESVTRYEIVLLDGRQTEAGRIAAGAGAALVLTSEDLAPLRDRPRPWYVRIEAFDGGDLRLRSLPRILSEPTPPTGPGR